MLTRRCTQRMFLLRPDAITNESFAYCFAVAAAEHQMEVHSLVVMSNHYHANVRDVLGRYPRFLRYFHSLVARCINCHRGRWESLWVTSEQPGALHLADADATLSKMVYGLANPVKDHLVDTAANWPGLSSYRYQLADKPLVVKRPKRFFDPNGNMPELASLRFVRPPEFADMSHEEWAALLRTKVQEQEQKAARRRRETGLRVLGRKAIRRQSPFSVPKSVAARRRMVPRVASRNKWLRVEQLRRNKQFQQSYRDARKLWRQGEDAIFPYGTYQLVRLRGVTCAPPPPAPNPAC